MNQTKTQYAYEIRLWDTGKIIRSEWRDSESERDRAFKKLNATQDWSGCAHRFIQRTVPTEESAPKSPG